MRKSDDNDEAWLRLLWEYSGKGLLPNGTHRVPNAAERKQIVRQLRNLKPMRPGHEIKRTTEAAYRRGMQFIDTLFHNAEAARRGKLDWLKEVPPEERYARMPKPWKGKAGREKHAEKANADALARRARELSDAEPKPTYLQIAEQLGLKGKPESLQKQVSRLLKRAGKLPDIPNS